MGWRAAWRVCYHAYDYVHDDMGALLAAANLAVCRSGASTLGELPLFGLPAVLVPYPYAWRYQKVNADYLVGRGGAEILLDNQLGEDLGPALERLLADPRRLEKMSKAMLRLGTPDAANQIANMIRRINRRTV